MTKDKAKEIKVIIEKTLKEVYQFSLVTDKQKEFFELCEERIRSINLKSEIK